MTDKEKLHQILSSLWKNDDSIGKVYYNQALQDVQIAIDSLQEEPALKVFEDMPLDPNIQYASREIGIKAHAEDYSFNIESELFQQLNKEQQELWRKEIEQACMSGGYCGLNLGLDKRYDKEEPVSKDFEMALAEMVAKAQKCVVEPWVVAAQWKDELIKLAKSEEPVSDDLGEYINELSKQFPEVSFAKLSRIAVRVAKWQKQQMMKEMAIDCEVKADSDGLFTTETWDDVNNLLQNINAKEGDKAKLIIIKED